MPLNMANSLASMAAGQLGLRGDSSRFLVIFDDGKYDLGSWAKVSGLQVSYEMAEYRCGDSNQVWKMPGNTKYSNITLSRATSIDSYLVQEWLAETSREPQVFSGCIQLQTIVGIPLCEWTLKSFVPCGWKITDVESKAATVVMESLELAHTGFLNDDLKLPGKPGGGL
jgi:phage tail-like protein